MHNRIWAAFFSFNLAFFMLMGGCATADSPEVQSTRIVAIGDLHGDYDAYIGLLKTAGLINNRKRWRGDDTILVQTGDVPDRGPDTLKIIEHLMKLKKQAARKGGDVVTLVGNHEAMNMTGDLRYVDPGEYAAFSNRNSAALRDVVFTANKESIEAYYLNEDGTLSSNEIKDRWLEATPLGMIEHQRAWRPDGEIGEWVSNNPAVVLIDGTIFVHGGISDKYAVYSIEEINNMTAAALTDRSQDPASIINDEYGPLWYRGLVQRAELEGDPVALEQFESRLTKEEEIALVLEKFGADRIVVGHTPSLTGIESSHGGRLIQIDTGISDYYGGAHSYLEIVGDVVRASNNGNLTVIDDGNEGE